MLLKIIFSSHSALLTSHFLFNLPPPTPEAYHNRYRQWPFSTSQCPAPACWSPATANHVPPSRPQGRELDVRYLRQPNLCNQDPDRQNLPGGGPSCVCTILPRATVLAGCCRQSRPLRRPGPDALRDAAARSMRRVAWSSCVIEELKLTPGHDQSLHGGG